MISAKKEINFFEKLQRRLFKLYVDSTFKTNIKAQKRSYTKKQIQFWKQLSHFLYAVFQCKNLHFILQPRKVVLQSSSLSAWLN